jgi:hypothetical protein
VLFSVDTVERDEFELEKVENHSPADMGKHYILSIEEI